MFHSTIIAAKKKAIEKKIKRTLTEYSVEYCIKQYEHFKSLQQQDGKQVYYCRPGQNPEDFNFTKEEAEFIANEKYMCSISFVYWFYRYFFIKDMRNEVRRPELLVAQQIFLAILADLDLRRLPIKLLILKARQLGMSTIVEAIILWISLFVYGAHCVIASAQEDKSEKMSEMVWLGLEMLPLFMQPVLTRDNVKQGPAFGEIKSDILIQHGATLTGIGRGDTVIGAHLCLRGDALVFTQDGNLIPIEDLKIGQKVWTHTGKEARVKAICRNPAKKRKMLQVFTWLNCEPVHLTSDHKLWTSRGWIKAEELVSGKDEIGTPIRSIATEITHLVTEEIRDVDGRLKRGKSKAQQIPLGREFGFFCGYYLAEGSLDFNGNKPCKTVLTHHVEEVAFSERAKAAVSQYCTSHKTKAKEDTNTGVTTIYGTSLATLVLKEFGKVNSKRIPDWVFKSNPEFIKGIVLGYLSGDGSKGINKNNPSFSVTSTRPRLLYQLRHLLASVGWGWGGISKEEAFVDKRGWTNRESWTLTINGAAAQRLRGELGIAQVADYAEQSYVNKYRIDGGWVFCKVKDIHLSFADDVWDIEVANKDHSFETVIGAVANSEIPYYSDPEETIESALLNAMHENYKTFIALEGTARRKGDWWHERWLKEREGEKDGRNEFVCLFLPWYVGHDKYPTADWLRNHPIPDAWVPLRETVKQASDAELYVGTTPLLKKYMGNNWRMPTEQMWFWEHKYCLAKRKDSTYKKFLAEFASDERSCFQSQRYSVFAQEVLDRLEQEQAKRFVDYAIVGDGIDPKFSLADFQSQSLRRIDIDWRTLEGRVLHWKLIPLEKTPAEKSLQFYLRMFEPVKPGFNYTIGIDISTGQGQNRTVYFVNRASRKENEPDVEVALLCSPWIGSPETPGFANCLGIYYGEHMSPTREALIAPETQRAAGDFICGQLNKLGYVNLYMMERWDIRRPAGFRPTRFGWTTTNWSQQLVKESFEHAIRTGWMKVNSAELVSELGWIEAEETDSGKMVYDHQKGKTDDVYMAGGISYLVSHSKDTIIERMKADFGPPPEKIVVPKVQKDSLQSRMSRRFQREDRESGFGREEGEGDPSIYVY